MFLHAGFVHLLSNLVMQLRLAILLVRPRSAVGRDARLVRYWCTRYVVARAGAEVGHQNLPSVVLLLGRVFGAV